MKKTALILSGGGALGIAHVGALEILETQYRFDWYAGVSAGAIVCSLLAIGKTAEEIDTILKKTNIFDLLFDLRPTQFGFMSGGNIEKILQNIFEDQLIEDLEVPLAIGATDFSTGERITIRSGKITDAIRASVSVPVVFEPYWHENEKKWMVDGGLSQNFPLDLAVNEYTGKHIIGIDVGSAIEPDMDFGKKNFWKRGEHISHSFIRSIRIMFKNQCKAQPDSRVILIEPKIGKYLATDILKYKGLKEEGQKAAKLI